MAVCIYVSGLPKTTTEGSLVEYFSHYGAVKVLGIDTEVDDAGKAVRWATVSFRESKNATQALKDADLHIVDGRAVKVSPAEETSTASSAAGKKRQAQKEAGEEDELAVECDDEEEVAALQENRSRIVAVSSEGKPKAKVAKVAARAESPEAGPNQAGSAPTAKAATRVLVRGLSQKSSLEATAGRVSEYFEYYGHVRKVEAIPGPDPALCRGMAIVRLDSAEGVKKAVKEKEQHVIGGKVIKVSALASGQDKIFVSGLPPRPKSTPEKIYSYFAEWGEIRTVTLKSKSEHNTFAFVHFIDPESVSQVCLQQDLTFLGCAILVKGYTNNSPVTKVFVSKLPKKSTQASVKKYFEHYGQVVSANVRTNAEKECAGVAIVEFEDPVSADLAANEAEHVIDGRHALVRVFKAEKPVRLFIANLSQATTNDSLSEYLSFYGAVDHCKVITNRETGESRRFAFAVFVDPAHAKVAAQESNHLLDQHAINIKVAKGEPGVKLFVSGLSSKTTSDLLSEYLSYYGDVDSCEVKVDPQTSKSRKFAFAEFVDKQSATLALEDKTHALQGKPITIRTSNKRSGRNKRQLFIGGISPDTTNESLWEYLSYYGDVSSVEVQYGDDGRSRCFAFGSFEEEQSAELAITEQEQHVVDGKAIHIQKSDPANKRAKLARIFVGGLSPETTSESLFAYLAYYGEAKECEVKSDEAGRSRGFAFVSFEDAETAQLVIDEEEHLLDGRAITVREAVKGGGKGGKGGKKGKGKAGAVNTEDDGWGEEVTEDMLW